MQIRSKTLEKFSHSFAQNYGKTFCFCPYIFPKFSVCFFRKDLNHYMIINQEVTVIEKEKSESLLTDRLRPRTQSPPSTDHHFLASGKSKCMKKGLLASKNGCKNRRASFFLRNLHAIQHTVSHLWCRWCR